MEQLSCHRSIHATLQQKESTRQPFFCMRRSSYARKHILFRDPVGNWANVSVTEKQQQQLALTYVHHQQQGDDLAFDRPVVSLVQG
jgi:glycine cleavage system H lipoate-binding protein